MAPDDAATVQADDHPDTEADSHSRWQVNAWSFALTWAVLMVSGASGQLYDAFVYSNSSLELLNGTMGPEGAGRRGALTSVIYLPTAIGTKVGLTVEMGVLAQNAALLAALGAFLLPALVSLSGVLARPRVIWCCALVVVILGRFAPAGLMDLWAMSAVLLAVTLVARPTALRVLAAGTLMGAAINLRPAYLLAGVLLLVMWALWVRRHWVWLALGYVMVVVPQGMMELARPGSFRLWLDGTRAINELQLSYSAWVVRYDTVPSSPQPQQFFCAPDMAAAQHEAIKSPVGLAMHLVSQVPQSIDLALQKMTAWLMWTWSTPYLDTFDPYISQLSVLVVAVVVLGGFGWIQAITRNEVPRTVIVPVLGLTIGLLLGAVAATPEARFAIALVTLGIAGVVQVRFDRMRARQVVWVVLLIAIVIVMGRRGLAHPAPPGDVTPEICASASTD